MNLNLFEIVFRRNELRTLREKVQEHESGDKFVLSSNERLLILDALCNDYYKAKVENPKTKYYIRQLYKNIKIRLAKKEVEMPGDFVKNIKGRQ